MNLLVLFMSCVFSLYSSSLYAFISIEKIPELQSLILHASLFRVHHCHYFGVHPCVLLLIPLLYVGTHIHIPNEEGIKILVYVNCDMGFYFLPTVYPVVVYFFSRLSSISLYRCHSPLVVISVTIWVVFHFWPLQTMLLHMHSLSS